MNRRTAPLAMLALAAVLTTGLAAAPDAEARTRKPRAAKQEPTLPGGETQRQRDKRLLRECRGRPNAGACLGYAS